jgi:hypothetical protein
MQKRIGFPREIATSAVPPRNDTVHAANDQEDEKILLPYVIASEARQSSKTIDYLLQISLLPLRMRMYPSDFFTNFLFSKRKLL